jgi:carbon-monoxide dehydrogenase small subunit
MKIPVTLNGEQIVLPANPDTKLLEALRNRNRSDVKCGCNAGLCGSCAILLDDVPVPACIIPVAAARNCTIVTLDYFVTTNEYIPIKKGFEFAGLELCGYCNAGKIFAAHHLISRYEQLTRQQIQFVLASLRCRCTDENLLTNAVAYASTYKEKQEKRENHER